MSPAAKQLAEALDNRQDLRLARRAGAQGEAPGPGGCARMNGVLAASAGQLSSRSFGGHSLIT